MKNVTCLWWSSKLPCAFCPSCTPFGRNPTWLMCWDATLKEKKPMEECWQPILVNKVKHDLKNTLCSWFAWNSLFSDLGQSLAVGHPSGIHQPCTASDIMKILPKAFAVVLLPCCSHHVRAWLSALCSTSRWTSLGRAPQTSGPHWWHPHGSFPVGAGWSWVTQHWVSPVFPTWALRPRKDSLVQLSCTSLGKAFMELSPGLFSPQGLKQTIPVVDFYTVTAVLGHPPAQRFCQRSRKGPEGLLWCWWKLLVLVWPLLPVCSSISVFKLLKWLNPEQIQL